MKLAMAVAEAPTRLSKIPKLGTDCAVKSMTATTQPLKTHLFQ